MLPGSQMPHGHMGMGMYPGMQYPSGPPMQPGMHGYAPSAPNTQSFYHPPGQPPNHPIKQEPDYGAYNQNYSTDRSNPQGPPQANYAYRQLPNTVLDPRAGGSDNISAAMDPRFRQNINVYGPTANAQQNPASAYSSTTWTGPSAPPPQGGLARPEGVWNHDNVPAGNPTPTRPNQQYPPTGGQPNA